MVNFSHCTRVVLLFAWFSRTESLCVHSYMRMPSFELLHMLFYVDVCSIEKEVCLKILFLTNRGRQTGPTTRQKYWKRVREKHIPHAESREGLWSNLAAGASARQKTAQTDFQTKSNFFHPLVTLWFKCKTRKGCNVIYLIPVCY